VLLNANSVNFLLYHGENKLVFNEMMMRSALYYTNTPSWIVIVLTKTKSKIVFVCLYLII
jgi:hypothetical protein